MLCMAFRYEKVAGDVFRTKKVRYCDSCLGMFSTKDRPENPDRAVGWFRTGHALGRGDVLLSHSRVCGYHGPVHSVEQPTKNTWRIARSAKLELNLVNSP